MNNAKTLHAYQLTRAQIAALKKTGQKLPLALRLREIDNEIAVLDRADHRNATTA